MLVPPLYTRYHQSRLPGAVYLEPGRATAPELGVEAIVELDVAQVVQVGLAQLVLLLPPLALHTVPSVGALLLQTIWVGCSPGKTIRGMFSVDNCFVKPDLR